MWELSSIYKMIYLPFLLKDLNGVTPEKNCYFPESGVSHVVVGDIATLTVQLRVQLATLHNTGQGLLASVHFIQCTRAPKSMTLLQTLKKNTTSLLPKPFCSAVLNTGTLGFTWPGKKRSIQVWPWTHYFAYSRKKVVLITKLNRFCDRHKMKQVLVTSQLEKIDRNINKIHWTIAKIKVYQPFPSSSS